MTVDGKKLAELVAIGCQRFIDPVLTRVKALEERSANVAALEARIKLLEQRLGVEGDGA